MEFVTNEENSEEEADMCYALEQLQRNAEKQGKRQGIKQGIQQGIQQGIKQGIQQGIQQGIKQGAQQMNELVRRLLADGRQDDLLRATADAGYRRKLLAEYKI